MVQGLKMRYASGLTSNKAKITAQEKLCGFKPDICSSSLIGAERKQPGHRCQGASCLNLCQHICHRGLIDQRNSQPLSLMLRSSVGSSHNSQLKPHDTEHQREVEEEEGRRRVKPNPWLDSLLVVNTVKSPKVYCLSICKQSKEGLYSQEASESSVTAWPSCVFMEPGSNLTCFSLSATPAKDARKWYKAGNQHWLSGQGEGCLACYAETLISIEHLCLIRQCSTLLASCSWKSV